MPGHESICLLFFIIHTAATQLRDGYVFILLLFARHLLIL